MNYLTPADVGISDDRAAHIRRNSKEPGTDYRTAYGTDLRVPADGVVITVDNSNYGAEGRRIAFLLDDGRQVDWIHLASIQAKLGQRVSRGQRGVALSGASGYGKDWYYDPHVHVTLRARRGLPYTNTLDFEKHIGGSAAGGSATPSTPATPESEEDDDMYIANVKNGNFYLVIGKQAHALGANSGARQSGIPIINYPDDWAVKQLKAGGVTGIA